MVGGQTTESAVYNNFAVNSLSFGKSPLEALGSNGGFAGEWKDAKSSHRLNTYSHDNYNGTGTVPLSMTVYDVIECMRCELL